MPSPVGRTAPYIAVVGGHPASPAHLDHAEAVGRELARRGAVLVCGGLGGVMEAACRGAKSAGGTTIGILPGLDRSDANDHVDVAITTGMGEMRNVLIIRSAQAVIAIGGGLGTLSEIAFALKTETPVVGLETWQLAGHQDTTIPIERVDSPLAAVERALAAAAAR